MKEFNELIKYLFNLNDRELFENFIYGLTTEKERQEFIVRVEIVKRLLQKQPQHKIAHDLGVGVSTVTRGSKELQKGSFKALSIEEHSKTGKGWLTPT